jgi:hypothetical protein
MAKHTQQINSVVKKLGKLGFYNGPEDMIHIQYTGKDYDHEYISDYDCSYTITELLQLTEGYDPDTVVVEASRDGDLNVYQMIKVTDAEKAEWVETSRKLSFENWQKEYKKLNDSLKELTEQQKAWDAHIEELKRIHAK